MAKTGQGGVVVQHAKRHHECCSPIQTATALKPQLRSTLQVHNAGDAHKSGHSDMETVASELVPWSGGVHF